jgi:flavin reductase (DIM6/NTAB) family NADH-FMN oxidoreductase RutF
MTRQAVAHTDHFAAVMRIMARQGLLLGTYDAEGKPNLMTIGWGTIGIVWTKPVWTVMVRPSRYTYECLAHEGVFTVNVPTTALTEACRVCGSKSGRDTDKFSVCRLTAVRAESVAAPAVAECPLVYECKIVHNNDLVPTNLTEEIRRGAYPKGDFHRIYWGEILATRAEPDAADLLTI